MYMYRYIIHVSCICLALVGVYGSKGFLLVWEKIMQTKNLKAKIRDALEPKCLET